MTREILSSAPAKVILCGEHAVVYGEPALVTAINLKAYCRLIETDTGKIEITSRNLGKSISYALDSKERPPRNELYPILRSLLHILNKFDERVSARIEISSEIPVSAGLGSSAAVPVACSAALYYFINGKLDREAVMEAAREAEKIVHGRPSGIDTMIATFGGVYAYRKFEEPIKIDVPRDFPKILVIDTGIKRSTGALVEKVRRLKEKYPKVIDPVIHAIGRLTIEAIYAIFDRDYERLGELLTLNHRLLSTIGVSHEQLDLIVKTAIENGALGAKLTGAGGGGCAIAICYEEHVERVTNALKVRGFRCFSVNVSEDGVIIERK